MIVNLADYRNKGNGAREALLKALGSAPFFEEMAADHILASLWMAGFKVVPLEPGDEDAV